MSIEPLQQNEIIELTVLMSNTKEDLLGYIEYFYGKHSDEYWDADFLVNSHADLKQWFILYDGNPDEIDEANIRLRRWKIDYNMTEFDLFEDLWELDKVDFIETYFQQRGMDRCIWEIDNALGNGLSVEILYNKHKNSRYSRVEYLLEV